jgi:hypothetical protein
MVEEDPILRFLCGLVLERHMWVSERVLSWHWATLPVFLVLEDYSKESSVPFPEEESLHWQLYGMDYLKESVHHCQFST